MLESLVIVMIGNAGMFPGNPPFWDEYERTKPNLTGCDANFFEDPVLSVLYVPYIWPLLNMYARCIPIFINQTLLSLIQVH